MNKENKFNGLVPVDKKKLGEILDEFNVSVEPKKPKWYYCNICGDPYREGELIDDEDVGYICDGCVISKKELDDEQEEAEILRREEKKSKCF